jgi:hypothetical protein
MLQTGVGIGIDYIVFCVLGRQRSRDLPKRCLSRGEVYEYVVCMMQGKASPTPNVEELD